jgi:UDP-N-acetylmuramoyl-L-alanyl-D-glutamate--2,6-diaminopimelate ligase
MDILNEIDAAFPEGSCARVKIADRAEAIRFAVDMAQRGDIILLAGKGHENYQLVGTKRIPFSEVEILKEALAERTKPTDGNDGDLFIEEIYDEV